MNLSDAILRHVRSWTETEIIIAGVLATIGTVVFAVVIYVNFPHVPFVNELTGGYAVWIDANKVRDVAILPIALALFIVVFTALLISPSGLEAQARRLAWLVRRPKVDSETVEAISVVAAAAILTVYGQIDFYLAAAVIWHLVYRRRFLKRYGTPASSIEITVAVLLIDAVSRFAGVAQSLAGQALIVSVLLQEAILRLPYTWLQSGRRAIAIAGHAAVAWWSLEFLALWRVPAATLGPAMPPFLVSIVVALLAAALLIDGVRRAYFGNAEARLYGPAIAIALALCLCFHLWSGSVLPSDDYHYGEHIWPLWQTLAFGQQLFVDIVPAHGLNDIAGAGFAQVLFGHLTGTNILTGWTYAGVVIVGIAGFVLARRLPVGLTFFLLLVLNQSVAVVVIYMTLVLEIAQSPRFSRMLPIYLLLSFIMSFAEAGLGSAAVAASVVPVALRAALELRRDRQSFLLSFGVTIGLAAALAIIFNEPMRHHFAYILVSAKTNLTVYGVPWESSFVSGWPEWALEWRRYSWTVLITVLPVMMVLTWKRSAPTEAKVNVTAGLAYLLTFILLSDSYANGRIDPGGLSRAGNTSIVLWTLFAQFGASAFRTTVSRKAAVGFAVVMLASLLTFPNVRAQLLTKPFEHPSDLTLISERLPAMGYGSADAVGLRRAEIVKEVMDTLLEPDETFLSITNRTALYFYARRPSPIPIAAVYNAAPNYFQREAIDALKRNPPPVALLSSDNMLFDGGPLSIRAYEIYRFVVENYEPFYYRGMLFGLSRKLKSRAEQLSKNQLSKDLVLQFTASSLTDMNWMRGVARPKLSSTWSFFTEDKGVFSLLHIGDKLRFADGSIRDVEALNWPNVKVSGPALDPDAVGSPHQILVEGREPLSFPPAMLTYDQLFGFSDLQSLPSAWGRSYRMLDKQLIKRSDLVKPVGTHDVVVLDDSWYQPTGNNPFIIFDTPQIKGEEQGVLGLYLRCEGLKAPDTIRMKIYWHAVSEEFSEDHVIRFAAKPGFQLVPMDSRISWAGVNVAQLQINLQEAGACKRFRIDGVQLFQRTRLN
jgi:hypothetical protein